MLDVRKPIGLLFLLIGSLLVLTGLFDHETIKQVDIVGVQHAINLDLIWGSVMVVFGLLMLGLAKAFATKSEINE